MRIFCTIQSIPKIQISFCRNNDRCSLLLLIVVNLEVLEDPGSFRAGIGDYYKADDGSKCYFPAKIPDQPQDELAACAKQKALDRLII